MIPFDYQDTEGKPGGSRILDELLSRLQNTLQSLARAVTNERLIRVTFTAATTDTPVIHGLKQPVTTWDIVDRSANAVVWQSATVNTEMAKKIILQASAPVTVLVRFS